MINSIKTDSLFKFFIKVVSLFSLYVFLSCSKQAELPLNVIQKAWEETFSDNIRSCFVSTRGQIIGIGFLNSYILYDKYGNKILKIDMPDKIRYAGIDNDNKFIYIVKEYSTEIYDLDGKKINTIKISPNNEISVSEDAKYLIESPNPLKEKKFFSVKSYGAIYDVNSFKLIFKTETAIGISGLAISPDSKNIIYGNFAERLIKYLVYSQETKKYKVEWTYRLKHPDRVFYSKILGNERKNPVATTVKGKLFYFSNDGKLKFLKDISNLKLGLLKDIKLSMKNALTIQGESGIFYLYFNGRVESIYTYSVNLISELYRKKFNNEPFFTTISTSQEAAVVILDNKRTIAYLKLKPAK